jgi:hypothetical protein
VRYGIVLTGSVVALLSGSAVATALPSSTQSGDYRFAQLRVASTPKGVHHVVEDVDGITAAGGIVGTLSGPGPNGARGFIERPGGKVTWLHVKGYSGSIANAVANDGAVVFTVFSPRRPLSANYVRRPSGRPMRVHTPGLEPSEVSIAVINDSGTMVGSIPGTHGSRSFVIRNGHLRWFKLRLSAARQTYVSGVNDNGVIVGSFATRTGATRGFIDRHGHVQVINLPRAGTHDGRGSRVAFIADSGEWIGESTTDDTNADTLAFVHRPGRRLVRLRYPRSGASTYGEFISKAGVIVGSYSYWTDGPTLRGFIAQPRT